MNLDNRTTDRQPYADAIGLGGIDPLERMVEILDSRQDGPRIPVNAFQHNAVRLQLHALAYSLTNFLRTLALPEDVEQWSLTTLLEKLVKIGARIARHGRYVVFQLAEVAVPRALFAEILRRIAWLRSRPCPT